MLWAMISNVCVNVKMQERKGSGRAARGQARGQCVRARSHIPAGENPAPARQASHRKEKPGPARVIAKVKHRGIETAGRKR